ncbi:MAG: flagellar hook-basal body complex protein FliE [Armatimonadetes bacterium]|nr:flagellar hook-basal body complex protein FliE [Armatimonadota bacterium]
MRIDNATPNLKIQDHLNSQLKGDNGDDFGDMLMDVMKEVNQAQNDSRGKQESFMAGQSVDVDDLMISMERASVSMQLTMQVRNKVLEAYQEMIRMQV